MENLNLYYWKFYDGREGRLEGLFLATEEEMRKSYGRNVTLGEVLGKHSEVYGDFLEADVSLRSNDPNLIQMLISTVTMVEENTFCGYNPLHYINVECQSCGDEHTPENMVGDMCWICNDLFEKALLD